MDVPASDRASPIARALLTLGAEGALGPTLAADAWGAVMDGAGSDPAIAALLMGMRIRGETVDELAAIVGAIRARMVALGAVPGAIDVCGTGGDGADTLNVSTAVAFVVAGCGVAVAKHGNAAVSSRSGGSDVLRALGIDPDPAPARQAARLDAGRLAFLHAPRHHPALRHAAAARRVLGFRTVLNLVGPLCNPAAVRRQLLGVSSADRLDLVAAALRALGAERAWVVHGDGLDELTLAGASAVREIGADGTIRAFQVRPGDAGLAEAPAEMLRGGDPAFNATALERMLRGETGPYRDVVLLNAAAALVVADRASTLRDGAAMASRAIDDGRAARALDEIRAALPAGRDAGAAVVAAAATVSDAGILAASHATTASASHATTSHASHATTSTASHATTSFASHATTHAGGRSGR